MSNSGPPIRLSAIEVRQFGGIDRLRVDDLPDGEDGQWLVVLGDNGSGKSSLLRGIALAAASNLGPLAPMAVWSSTSLALEREGGLPEASVHTTRGEWFLKMRRDQQFRVRGQETFFLAGYGVSRGGALGGPDRSVDLDNRHGNIGTLFSLTGHPLVHAETWLGQVRLEALESGDSTYFDAISKTLVSVLPGAKQLDVKRDGVWVSGSFGRVPLAGLSDGYITTLGWTLDLLARWERWARSHDLALGEDFARSMTGLVLVDELDLHLHPRWQRQIIGSLRRAFPKLSFVCTTHNPLTLLGAKAGEVFTLEQEDGEHVLVRRDLPSGIRADQVLTGPWFGLSSTLDRGTLQMLGRHRNMLSDGVARDDEKRVELESRIRERLGSYAELAEERMALNYLAEVLPKEPELSVDQRVKALEMLDAHLDRRR